MTIVKVGEGGEQQKYGPQCDTPMPVYLNCNLLFHVSVQVDKHIHLTLFEPMFPIFIPQNPRKPYIWSSKVFKRGRKLKHCFKVVACTIILFDDIVFYAKFLLLL